MAEFPALPLWTDAFLADTTHLSRDEIGAYLLLLFAEWRRPDCKLPDDDRYLARITRCSPDEWAALRPVMEQFFSIEDGFWSQKRLVSERDKVKARADRARANGRAGGRPRKQETNDLKNPAGSCSETQKKAPHIHIHIPSSVSNETEDSPPPARAAQAALLADFKVWYAKYPRKVAPRKAEAAYLAARRRGATAEDLLAGLDRYMRTKPEYADWAHPTTWLNGDRWKDGIAPDGVATDADAPVPLDESLEPYREKLEKQFDRATLASWFKPSVRLHEDDGWFTLIAPTPFHATYMQTNYQTRLRAVFGDQFHGVTHRKRAA